LIASKIADARGWMRASAPTATVDGVKSTTIEIV